MVKGTTRSTGASKGRSAADAAEAAAAAAMASTATKPQSVRQRGGRTFNQSENRARTLSRSSSRSATEVHSSTSKTSNDQTNHEMKTNGNAQLFDSPSILLTPEDYEHQKLPAPASIGKAKIINGNGQQSTNSLDSSSNLLSPEDCAHETLPAAVNTSQGVITNGNNQQTTNSFDSSCVVLTPKDYEHILYAFDSNTFVSVVSSTTTTTTTTNGDSNKLVSKNPTLNLLLSTPVKSPPNSLLSLLDDAATVGKPPSAPANDKTFTTQSYTGLIPSTSGAPTMQTDDAEVELNDKDVDEMSDIEFDPDHITAEEQRWLDGKETYGVTSASLLNGNSGGEQVSDSVLDESLGVYAKEAEELFKEFEKEIGKKFGKELVEEEEANEVNKKPMGRLEDFVDTLAPENFSKVMMITKSEPRRKKSGQTTTANNATILAPPEPMDSEPRVATPDNVPQKETPKVEEITFVEEIRNIMHSFGDTKHPLMDTAQLVERIVHNQLVLLINEAGKIALRRGNAITDETGRQENDKHPIKLQDFLFLLRKNPAKLTRLVKYLSIVDQKTKLTNLTANLENNNSAEPTEEDSQVDGLGSQAHRKKNATLGRVKGPRTRECYRFLALMDTGDGQLLKAFDENYIDELTEQRNKRLAELTEKMNVNDYYYYEKCRTVGFLKQKAKFQRWIELGLEEQTPTDVFLLNFSGKFKIDASCIEALNHFALETVANLVELALVVREDSRPNRHFLDAQMFCETRPEGANIPQASDKEAPELVRTLLENTASSLQALLKPEHQTSPGISVEHYIQARSITPAHIMEAMRRFESMAQASLPFAPTFSTFPSFVVPTKKLLCI